MPNTITHSTLGVLTNYNNEYVGKIDWLESACELVVETANELKLEALDRIANFIAEQADWQRQINKFIANDLKSNWLDNTVEPKIRGKFVNELSLKTAKFRIVEGSIAFVFLYHSDIIAKASIGAPSARSVRITGDVLNGPDFMDVVGGD